MSALKLATKLPHLTIERLLCNYGHVDYDNPLQHLLAAEEHGELAYPRQVAATVVTARHYSVNTLL